MKTVVNHTAIMEGKATLKFTVLFDKDLQQRFE